ncbi:MAG TPA: TolC family protein [Polyangia bacterium]|nr:TolC family protein [Polyangia bacterium]
MKAARFACPMLIAAAASPPALGAPSPADEAKLSEAAHLTDVLRLALERNPGLAEEEARARAAAARGRAAGHLPDPELKYEQWGVSLARPYGLDRADTVMVGLRQMFPAWGARAAGARGAEEEAARATAGSRAHRQELAGQVRQTYAAYARADEELRLHLEHVGLMAHLLELARLNQRTGHGSLQDTLRMELELTRLHTDVARIEREHRSSRAMLNTMMDRAPDAALGPPDPLAPPAEVDAAALERGVDDRRAEIGAAERALARSQALADAAWRAAHFPTVSVGLDYWYRPLSAESHHAYGAMVAINLPWLTGRGTDEARAAEQLVAADEHALAAARNAAHFQLQDAATRVRAAQQSFLLVEGQLLVQARRGFEAARAAYTTGAGDGVALLDASRLFLQARIERLQALAELVQGQAELERAAGVAAGEGARP